MKPWHDCPKCPHCGCSVGIPKRAWDWNHRADPGDDLACPACGGGWVGTPEDVAQAERAQTAWEAEKMRDAARAKAAEDRARYERAMRGEWATPPKITEGA